VLSNRELEEFSNLIFKGLTEQEVGMLEDMLTLYGLAETDEEEEYCFKKMAPFFEKSTLFCLQASKEVAKCEYLKKNKAK
jgi:hypothetical protein